ncbi:reprolysin-like metallopeptidase [Flavobacterium suaedae]|nr:zinc-dependent metalloprotease family protein [Flavobacterium suaedae]
MKRKLLLLLMVIVCNFSYAQNFWSGIAESRLDDAEKKERNVQPVKRYIFTLNTQAMKSALAEAPLRSNYTGESSVIIPLPNGEGKTEHFRVYETAVLNPELAANHPEIKTYIGQGVENPTSSVYFSTTIYGFHAMIFSTEGTSYIEPYTTDLQNYIVYKKSAIKTARHFACNMTKAIEEQAAPKSIPLSTQSSDGFFRTYRLAMACTIEYAAFHINEAGVNDGTLAEKKAAVLAAMVVTMTRVNGIYERDLSLTMQIVPDNEDIIYINSDNLNNDDAGELIGQIQSIINNAIGFNNYDIGHVVSTGGGGVANLGCVCTSNKARGVTGSFSPVGDPFDVDYVAHEMGHQFGANHTFNNSFQRTAETAVEPGSGSTIMAYAGISPPNVQNNSDDYFHTVSIDQIVSFINSTGGTCATEVLSGNNAPQIVPIPNYTIPKATAFVLRGNATDANNEVLTYCWEQVNANGAFSTQNDTPSKFSITGPNFRSLSPSESPDRYMPEFSSVLAGNLTPTWEVVPSVGRTLDFTLTVRDNQTPNGGQTATEDMSVEISNVAGPFEVTSQNEDNLSWNQGEQQTITWNVAATTTAGVNTANVNILLSLDGGITFDTVLAANTLNDGSETIIVPDVEGAFCRIIVEAVGNIFYAVNQKPFAVGTNVTTVCIEYSNENVVNIPDDATEFSSSEIEFPEEGAIQSVEVSVDITHPYVGDLFLSLVSPDGTTVELLSNECGQSDDLEVIFSDGGTPISCGSPTTGIILPEEALSAFEGEDPQGTWTLLYADGGAGDEGTLNSWAVDVCYTDLSAADTFSINNLTVYPNPNSGIFSVNFTSQSNTDVAITVHDVNGRVVYVNEYKNTGVINADVNLQSLQAGIYLVTVNDGEQKAVRKVVIQ